MKFCWDNIENIRLTKKGNFRDYVKKKTYYYYESCKTCGESFLYGKKDDCDFCCKKCRRFEKFTKKHKEKISQSKLKISGGYYPRGIPTYNTYAPQLDWCEEVRRNKEDPNVLEVKCFKCGEWYIPTLINTKNRVQYLKGNNVRHGESKFYCSQECKSSCSIYGKHTDVIIKEDAVRAGRLSWLELENEMQPELRKMVLERDNYECQKCGSTENLHCHHIYPVSIEPLLSADVDNCITLCYNCHKEAHTKDGCKLNQLKMEIC